MAIRGLRGAISVEKNTAQEIMKATSRLLKEMLKLNKLKKDDIASIIFTATPDLTAQFPAQAGRALGLTYTPLLCATEIKVVGGLKRCIRVLMHINTQKSQRKMRHVYLEKAAKLREDLV